MKALVISYVTTATKNRIPAKVVLENDFTGNDLNHTEALRHINYGPVVYQAKFTIAGKPCVYVGQTDEFGFSRLPNHTSYANWENNDCRFYKALRNADDAPTFYIDLYDSEQEAKEAEEQLIRQMNANSEIECLNVRIPNPKKTAAKKEKRAQTASRKDIRSKSIIAYKDGVVAKFDSVTDCCRALDLEPTNVSAILAGKLTKSGGPRTTSKGWRFIDITPKKRA